MESKATYFSLCNEQEKGPLEINNVDMTLTSRLEMQSLGPHFENLVTTLKQSDDPICFCDA